MVGIIENIRKVEVQSEKGDSLGKVSVSLSKPPHYTATAILAHGAGGSMDSPPLKEIQKHFAETSIASVRFNFLYKEAKRRAPDRTAVLLACWRSVADWVRSELDPRSLFLGGKSMGGRMASYIAAEGYPCDGLFFLGYPLHPPGRKDQLRKDHLPSIRVPMLFISGSRDPFCDLDLLRPALEPVRAPVHLHVVDEGDHSLRVPKRSGRSNAEITREVCELLVRFFHEPGAGL